MEREPMPLNSIADAWLGMTMPAQLAVLFFVGLLMMLSAIFVLHIESTQPKKHTKHRRQMLRKNNSKEDFFDMVTRFREEIDAGV